MSGFDVRHANATLDATISSADATPAPGRAAPTNKLAPTGDAYYDRGGPDGGRFLDKDQRDRVASEYGERVSRALSAYYTALSLLHAENLVQKDDDLPWVLTLLLEATSIGMERILTTALERLRGWGEAAVHDLYDWQVFGELSSWKLKLQGHLANVSDAHIKAIAKKPGDPLKSLVGKRVQSAYANRSDKAATDSYLRRLMREAGAVFQRIAEQPKRTASDAELLVLTHAFHEQYQNTDVYYVLLKDQVDRFAKSSARKIGTDISTLVPATLTHEAAWIELGVTRRLALMQETDREPEPEFIQYIEEEFEDVALERQLALYGAPRTFKFETRDGLAPALVEVGTSTVGAQATAMRLAGERGRKQLDDTIDRDERTSEAAKRFRGFGKAGAP